MKTFKHVSAVSGLLEIKLAAASYDFFLELKILDQHCLEVHYLGYAVIKSEHYHSDRFLQLREFIKLVHYDSRVRISLELDDDAHSLFIALIAQIGYAFYLLVLYLIGYVSDQFGFIHHIGDLCDEYAEPPVLLLLYLCFPSESDLASAGTVCRSDPASSHYYASGREVRSLDIIHQIKDIAVRIINEKIYSGYDFIQVMRRYVRCHTDGYSVRSVHQEVGDPCRQH